MDINCPVCEEKMEEGVGTLILYGETYGPIYKCKCGVTVANRITRTSDKVCANCGGTTQKKVGDTMLFGKYNDIWVCHTCNALTCIPQEEKELEKPPGGEKPQR